MEKLKLWGITQGQIDEILKQGKADFKVPIISPISGHVLKKNIVEGQYVQEGQAMFEIADLHTVWVKAQIYEDEVGPGPRRPVGRGGHRGVPGPDVPGQGRVRPAAPRPGDPDGRGALRPGEPWPHAPARDVRHGDAEDPGGRDAHVQGATRGVSSRGRCDPADEPDRRGAEDLPGHGRQARVDGRPDPGRDRGAGRSGLAAPPVRPSSRPTWPSTWLGSHHRPRTPC